MISNLKGENMKIPHPLKTHIDDRSLVIIVGGESAIIYSVNGKILRKEERIDPPKPSYSDREGFFMRSGHGKIMGSGSVMENQKIHVRNKLSKELGQKTKSIVKEKGIQSIYLFCPQYFCHYLKENLDASSKKLVKSKIFGNFIKNHPIDVLRKIKEKFDKTETKVPAKKGARKILSKVRKPIRSVRVK